MSHVETFAILATLFHGKIEKYCSNFSSSFLLRQHLWQQTCPNSAVLDIYYVNIMYAGRIPASPEFG